MTAAPTSEEIADLFDNGMLAGEMARQFGLNDPVDVQAVEARCAALHNAGTLDLFKLVEIGALLALDDPCFFMAMRFFCTILPNLEATPAQMMACVEALVARGGEDIAATRPNAAFRTWCKKAPRRAHEVIAAARDGDDLASRHLAFALEAINDISGARDIALTYDDTRRLSGITALGRIVDDDPASRAETLAIFSTILDRNADDPLRASLLAATMAISTRDGDIPLPGAVALVRRLAKDAGEFTLHQAAHVLRAYRKALQPDIVAALLGALMHINPANKGTVAELDLGLESLLETGHDTPAIAYVTQVLSGQDDGLKLSDLDGFTRSLFAGPAERLGRVIVQWLLMGAPRLCDGLAEAIKHRHPRGLPLTLQAEDLAISPSAQVFICRKAIGWFFLEPTTAASVLVSVLRICDEATALEVRGLLVEPLLLNYGGVRGYLAGLPPDDVAKARVDEALAQNDAYLDALDKVPDVKELRPSERHRRIERLCRSNQMRDAHKQAQRQSVFLSLIKHQVVLYGNRTLTFVKDGENTNRAVETDLRSFQVSYEMPRMEIVDPVGLDYMLRVFRVERMAS